MTIGRWIAIGLFVILFGAFFYFDLGQFLTLERIKAEQASLTTLVEEQPFESAAVYFALYVLITAVSLPGAAIMTLIGGALFGLLWGLIIVSFASTIGATLAMLIARWLLRDQIQRRFARQFEIINKGIETEGAFYLFSLRLVPVIPFFALNLVMGLTKISAPLFFIVSQVSMLAGTAVYVNAGTELGAVESASDILSPTLLGSFLLLAIFPWIAKWILEWIRARRVYAGYERPRAFDRDMVVIGAGSGGLVAALIAATVKAKVTLIEKNKMGGDCLNTGCVPSKTLIRSARLVFDASRGADLGLANTKLGVNFSGIMRRVHRAIKEIEPHDSVERYEGLGVDVEIGHGEIISPWQVRVNGKVLTTRNIVIATGAVPFVPPIRNIDEVDYLTSDNLWDLQELPEKLVVLGGGPIGTELTQAFGRLGSDVTQVELLPRILPREDEEFSSMIQTQLDIEGVKVLTGHRAEAVVKTDTGHALLCVDENGNEKQIAFDRLLVAVGRKAMVTGFGLETLGVAITEQGTVKVDEYLRTNFPNIYAIGDAAGPYQFTHTASHMAWYAAVNALFGTFKKFKVDYSVIPWATFCYPEVARVGLNEEDAIRDGIDYEVTTYDVAELDRAIAEEEAHGLVKVLTQRGRDRILGATIAADHAGDLISEFTLAMKCGIGLNKILGTIHVYPTFMEMNKFAASEWRKSHKPDWALAVAERYHRWRRGGPAGTAELDATDQKPVL